MKSDGSVIAGGSPTVLDMKSVDGPKTADMSGIVTPPAPGEVTKAAEVSTPPSAVEAFREVMEAAVNRAVAEVTKGFEAELTKRDASMADMQVLIDTLGAQPDQSRAPVRSLVGGLTESLTSDDAEVSKGAKIEKAQQIIDEEQRDVERGILMKRARGSAMNSSYAQQRLRDEFGFSEDQITDLLLS